MAIEIQNAVDVIAEIVSDDGTALAQREGPQALAQAQVLVQVVRDRLNTNQAYPTIWAQFQSDPQTNSQVLVGIIQAMCQSDPALARQLSELLAAYRRAAQLAIGGNISNINTGGGAYIGGGVHIGNGVQFAGRDQTISASNTIGIEQIFQNLYHQVDAKADLTTTDKNDIKAELRDVETELTKGSQANEDMVYRHLRNIERMAPDILDVVLTTFANPLLGLGMVAKKIAEKMKAEAEKK